MKAFLTHPLVVLTIGYTIVQVMVTALFGPFAPVAVAGLLILQLVGGKDNAEIKLARILAYLISLGVWWLVFKTLATKLIEILS